MREEIIVMLNPTEVQHTVYIVSNNTETIPVAVKATLEELPSVVAMSASKYNIHYIKLQGAHSYTAGIKDTLNNKISTCFGKENDFVIELI